MADTDDLIMAITGRSMAERGDRMTDKEALDRIAAMLAPLDDYDGADDILDDISWIVGQTGRKA